MYKKPWLPKGTVRSDRRCGPEFPLDDKTPSECDGESGNYCCSKFGYCGPGPDHCDCPECVDYRTSGSPKGTYTIRNIINVPPKNRILTGGTALFGGYVIGFYHPSCRGYIYNGQVRFFCIFFMQGYDFLHAFFTL